MDEIEYISERLDKQIEWYNDKSTSAKKRYKLLRMLQIVGAAVIPLIVGFGGESIYADICVGVISALIAIVTATIDLNQYYKNWVSYRTTCESLRHEKYFYLTKTGNYQGDNAFELFTGKIERLISQENSSWVEELSDHKKINLKGAN